MKNLLFLAAVAFQLCFFSEATYSQDTCCISQNRPIPGMGFADALSLCFINNEVECFRMNAPQMFEPLLGCPGNVMENPHVYILFPSDDAFTLSVEIDLCVNSKGIQAVLFELSSNPYELECSNFNPQLNPVITFCDPTLNRIEFMQSDAKEKVFYLVIDGFSGDICSYTIESIDGAFRSKLRDSLSLTGPQGVPEGYTATYSAEQFSFDCYRNYDCNCGFCSLDTFNVIWTGPPGTIINPIPGTLTADITFGTMGGSICIRIKDDCENLLRCIPVRITPTEYYTRCSFESLFIYDEIFDAAGTFYARDNNVNEIYEIVIADLPDIYNAFNFDLCVDETVEDCRNNVVAFPITYVYCQIRLGDDCIVTETFIEYHNNYDIVVLDTICEGEFILFCGDTLRESSSTICSFNSVFNCDSIVSLHLFVVSPDTVFIRDTLCEGMDILFCDELINQNGIYLCVDSTDGCIQYIVFEPLFLPIDTTYIDTMICFPKALILKGDTFSSAGDYLFNDPDVSICAGLIDLTITYFNLDTTFIFDSICGQVTYDFCGQSIATPGLYYCHLISSVGCDSIVTLSLVNPCPGPDLLILCDGEQVEYGDSLLSAAGTYYIEKLYGSMCSCVDTLTVQYVGLGNSLIVTSGGLTCDVESIMLGIALDPTSNVSVDEINWYYQDVFVSQEELLEASETGLYSSIVYYSNPLVGSCQDTLEFELDSRNEFNPNLVWLDQALTICDATDQPYQLSFETDAAQSVLTLLNTAEQWVNLSNIEVSLPATGVIFSFELTLFNETGVCEQVTTFEVERLSLETSWPDTVYRSGAGSVLGLENPLFNQQATNIISTPSNFVTSLSEQNLTFSPSANGLFNLSFDIGECTFNYRTFIVSSNIFVPNAFSPNNDGINDVFIPFVTDGVSIDQLAVYNRWGGEVFSTQASDLGWNGRSNGKALPAGIYVVRYTYSDANGNSYSGVSDLLLIR